MFDERVQTRSEQKAATRTKVLASAERLFREHGFAATTIRLIAADARVSLGTVMSVGDKDALLVAIFEGWIADVHQTRDVPAAGDPAGLDHASAVDALMELFEPFVDYFARDPELSREYGAIIVRGKHESVIFQGLALTLIAEIEHVLTRAGLSPADAGSGARVVYFAYLGLLMTASSGVIDMAMGASQLRQVVDFVVRQNNDRSD